MARPGRRLGSSLWVIMSSLFRPLINNASPLPDGQVGARTLLDERRTDGTRLVEIVAGIKQLSDVLLVLGPQLDFVEIARVRI